MHLSNGGDMGKYMRSNYFGLYNFNIVQLGICIESGYQGSNSDSWAPETVHLNGICGTQRRLKIKYLVFPVSGASWLVNGSILSELGDDALTTNCNPIHPRCQFWVCYRLPLTCMTCTQLVQQYNYLNCIICSQHIYSMVEFIVVVYILMAHLYAT